VKRFLFWFLAMLGLFILLFVGLNLFDSKPEPAVPAPGAPEGNLDPDNGFLLVWGFAEPPETDPLSPLYRGRLQELFAARPRNILIRSAYSQWLARLNDDFRRNWHDTAFYFPQQGQEDACAYVASRRAEVRERQNRLAVPLGRYRRILQAGDLADFTPLGWEFPARSSLLATHAARLFAASQTLAALDGHWLEAGAGLLDAMDAGFRLIGSGRTLAVNSLGKSMVELSLRTLASLLNRSDCPLEIARLVIERLPARPASAFGTGAARAFAWRSFASALERIKKDRVVDPFLLKDFFRNPAGLFALERFVAISGPRLFTAAHALASFFLKENETAAMMRAFWERVGILEESPPWKWEAAPLGQRRSSEVAAGPFWWLRNPLGKMMVRSAVPYTWPILQHYVHRSHELRARYELTRLLAGARLACGAGMKLGEKTLLRMLAGAGEVDPFSGRPYLYNPDSGMLYSVGSDRRDDHGREQPASWHDSDIAVRITFVR
jgi:hypothetical protein